MRLRTKQDRLNLQNHLFTSLEAKGFKKEIYKELVIFSQTNDNGTYVKIYSGTSTKELIYKRYRSEEQAAQEIERQKNNFDRIQKYKEERKKNKTASTAANCSSAIKAELKKVFPGVKFSVKSSNFSGGDSVHIEWENGPTYDMVRGITSKYQYGSFNSMEDIYENTNSRDDIPQTKYVQERRNVSEYITDLVVQHLESNFNEEGGHQIRSMAYRIINKTPIPLGATAIGLISIADCGVIEDVYTIQFDKPTTLEAANERPNIEKVEVPAGEVQIIEYSEKSIAIIGDTKPIKDKLKELGGKFNFRLSCGAGWIFPKTKLESIENLFTNNIA